MLIVPIGKAPGLKGLNVCEKALQTEEKGRLFWPVCFSNGCGGGAGTYLDRRQYSPYRLCPHC